jgi:Tfp pilus assembly protein FimV
LSSSPLVELDAAKKGDFYIALGENLARERAAKEQEERVKDENEQVGKMACEAAIDAEPQRKAVAAATAAGAERVLERQFRQTCCTRLWRSSSTAE